MTTSLTLHRKNLSRHARATRRDRLRRLGIEPLEKRYLLATVAWTGLGDGISWSNASNWDRNGVAVLPQTVDDVIIPNMGNQAIEGDLNIQFNTSVSLNSLTSSEALAIHGGSLSIAAGSTIRGGVSLVGGTVGGNGVLALHGTSQWSGGSMLTPAGKTIVANGATLTISSSDGKYLARTLENAGTIRYVGSSLQFGLPGLNMKQESSTISQEESLSPWGMVILSESGLPRMH